MKKIVLLLVLVFIGVSSTWAQALKFEDCGSQEGRLVKVEVTDNASVPIILLRGTHVYFTITFTAIETIDLGSVYVDGFLLFGDIAMPMVGFSPDPLGSVIKAGETKTLLIRLNIPKDFLTSEEYPDIEINFNLKLELINRRTGRAVVAFKLPAKIRTPKN